MKHGMKNELKKSIPNPWMEWKNPFSKNSNSSKSIENSIVGCYGAHHSYRTSNHIMYIRRIIIFLRSFATKTTNTKWRKKREESKWSTFSLWCLVVYRLSSIHIHYIWFCFFYFPITLLSLLSSYFLPVSSIPPVSFRRFFFFGSCLLPKPKRKSFVHIARSTVFAWNPKNVIVSFIFWLNCFDMHTRCLTFGWKCFYLKCLQYSALAAPCFCFAFYVFFFPVSSSFHLAIFHLPFAKIC